MSDANRNNQNEKAAKIRRKPERESALTPTFSVARQATPDRQQSQPPGCSLLQRQCSCGKHTIGGGLCEECQRKGEVASSHALDDLSSTMPPNIQTTRDSTTHFNLSHIPVQTHFTTNGQPLRPTLTVNAPGVQYEQESDHVAAAVMRMPSPLLTLPSTEIDNFTSPTVSRLPTISRLQTSGGNGPFQAPTSIENRINQIQGGGKGLPGEEKNSFEERIGYDFSQMRIYTNFNTVQAGRDIQVRVFTAGNHTEILHQPQSQQAITNKVLQRQLIPYSYAPPEMTEADVTNDPDGLSSARLEDLFVLYGAGWRLHRLPPSGAVYSREWVLGQAGTALIRGYIRSKLNTKIDRPRLQAWFLSRVERMRGASDRKSELRTMIDEAFARRDEPGRSLAEETSPVLADVGHQGRTFSPRGMSRDGTRDLSHRIHAGMDVPGPIRTGIYTPLDGRVIFAGQMSGFGNIVRILHASPPPTEIGGEGPVTTNYAHLDELLVSEGDTVSAGQAVGLMGNTRRGSRGGVGGVTRAMGVHLHFSVQRVPPGGPSRFSSRYEERRDIRIQPDTWLGQLGIQITGVNDRETEEAPSPNVQREINLQRYPNLDNNDPPHQSITENYRRWPEFQTEGNANELNNEHQDQATQSLFALTAKPVGMLQRQDNVCSSDDETMSQADTSPNPDRLRRLDDLTTRIDNETAQSTQLRRELDALQESSEEQLRLESDLNNSRTMLIDLLEERINLLNEEIASLDARIGPHPTSSAEHPELTELGHELSGREAELRQHQNQLRPLKRWRMRREIGSINEQLAAIDQELATLPQVCDPSDPTTTLLWERRTQLEQRKQELAESLTSTAHEYEQFDSRWGATRYGTSPECTNISEAGCGPTSLAIVLNYLYQEDPESLAASGQMEIVTPPETAQYAETNGRVCNSGTAGDTMVTNVHTGWPGFHGRRITLDQATAQLRNGNLVIFLCKNCEGRNQRGGSKSYGGHFMVLNGVNESEMEYNVLDPGANERNDILTISRQQLQTRTNGFWIVERRM